MSCRVETSKSPKKKLLPIIGYVHQLLKFRTGPKSKWFDMKLQTGNGLVAIESILSLIMSRQTCDEASTWLAGIDIGVGSKIFIGGQIFYYLTNTNQLLFGFD